MPKPHKPWLITTDCLSDKHSLKAEPSGPSPYKLTNNHFTQRAASPHPPWCTIGAAKPVQRHRATSTLQQHHPAAAHRAHCPHPGLSTYNAPDAHTNCRAPSLPFTYTAWTAELGATRAKSHCLSNSGSAFVGYLGTPALPTRMSLIDSGHILLQHVQMHPPQ